MKRRSYGRDAGLSFRILLTSSLLGLLYVIFAVVLFNVLSVGLVPLIVPNGSVWTVRRKGRKDLTEADVRAAGKAAGLVDVKVVRFSDTHTAEKFVIPVADR